MMFSDYLKQIKKMSEIKSFTSFKELGSYIKKVRRTNNEKLNTISSQLIIKKQLLQDIEEGNISADEFASNAYLKGFLNSYMRYLNINNIVQIDSIIKQNKSSAKKTSVPLETTEEKKNVYGSLLILMSLVLISLLYLIWNKATYYTLYKLGESLN